MPTVFTRIAGAGFKFDECVAVKEAIDKGVNVAVRLEPEEGNQFDSNAVRIMCRIGSGGMDLQIGYLPREESPRAKIAIAENRIIAVSIVRIGFKGGGSRHAWGQIKVEVKPSATPNYFVPKTSGPKTRPHFEDPANTDADLSPNPDGVRTDDPPPTTPPPDTPAPAKTKKRKTKKS
jgi:hypothetical protein